MEGGAQKGKLGVPAFAICRVLELVVDSRKEFFELCWPLRLLAEFMQRSFDTTVELVEKATTVPCRNT